MLPLQLCTSCCSQYTYTYTFCAFSVAQGMSPLICLLFLPLSVHVILNSFYHTHWNVSQAVRFIRSVCFWMLNITFTIKPYSIWYQSLPPPPQYECIHHKSLRLQLLSYLLHPTPVDCNQWFVWIDAVSFDVLPGFTVDRKIRINHDNNSMMITRI